MGQQRNLPKLKPPPGTKPRQRVRRNATERAYAEAAEMQRRQRIAQATPARARIRELRNNGMSFTDIVPVMARDYPPPPDGGRWGLVDVVKVYGGQE